MARLLVIEDDATVRETTVTYLRHAGHDARGVADGRDALAQFTTQGADLVLLDLMLPGLGGLEVCRRLRDVAPRLPVIMVTARSQPHERIQGLATGADDYLTKPFSLRELELRIASVLRRSLAQAPTERPQPWLRDGNLVVDVSARQVTTRQVTTAPTESSTRTEISLTTREFDLLLWFLRHPGRVASREELLREVWGWEVGDSSTVTVHVRRLREKVEVDPAQPARLVTVFGHGYRWDRTEPDAD